MGGRGMKEAGGRQGEGSNVRESEEDRGGKEERSE